MKSYLNNNDEMEYEQALFYRHLQRKIDDLENQLSMAEEYSFKLETELKSAQVKLEFWKDSFNKIVEGKSIYA